MSSFGCKGTVKKRTAQVFALFIPAGHCQVPAFSGMLIRTDFPGGAEGAEKCPPSACAPREAGRGGRFLADLSRGNRCGWPCGAESCRDFFSFEASCGWHAAREAVVSPCVLPLFRMMFPGAAVPWRGEAVPWRGAAVSWSGAAVSWRGEAVPWRGEAVPWLGAAVPWRGVAVSWRNVVAIFRGRRPARLFYGSHNVKIRRKRTARALGSGLFAGFAGRCPRWGIGRPFRGLSAGLFMVLHLPAMFRLGRIKLENCVFACFCARLCHLCFTKIVAARQNQA